MLILRIFHISTQISHIPMLILHITIPFPAFCSPIPISANTDSLVSL